MKRALTISAIILGVLSVLLLACFFYYFGVTAGVKLDKNKLTTENTFLTLYDANGEKIEASAIRASADSAEIPEHVKNAFVAVEDKRFYAHKGIDYKRMFAAGWKNLVSFSFREGASTISQQLIKNTHLTSEKTIHRKLKEIKLARILEQQYSKDEILTLYLNSIYFGHSAFGIENASRFYFGKSASELLPAEGAMLAALIRSPNRYSPFRDAEACKLRRDLVLRLMLEQGYIEQSTYEAAAAAPLPTAPAESGAENAYLARVYDELAALFPDARSGDWGSLKIYTYYDPAIQAELEKTSADSDVCILVRDNRSHALSALYATAGTPARLPASTIKPLAVYGPALEENLICPATPILDEKTTFGDYSPDDFGGATGEYMSARYALAHSVNIPAVKLLNQLSVERAADYLSRMQLDLGETDRSLALALGGMSRGFTLPALADAYATFANGGVFAPCTTVRRVEDDRGRTLYGHAPTTRRVFSADVSAIMNDMLQTAVQEGTAKKLKTLPFPVCAKTGTAEGVHGNTDAYCIAYTHDHVVAVWMGNEDYTPIQATGGGLPANAALKAMKALYTKGSPSQFESSDDVVKLRYDKTVYDTEHLLLLSDPAAPPGTDREELFRRSAQPSASSSFYSCPTIQTPSIFCKNGSVQIVLCQTEYYDYEIKRENRGKITTIYSGKYRQTICDNSVKAGEKYIYTVIPKYREHAGTAVVLPEIYIENSVSIPDGWWREQP